MSQIKKHRILDGIDGAIFDLDGTLVDSMDVWHRIDIEYTNRIGVPLPEDLHREIEGLSFQEVAAYFRHRFELDKTDEEIMQEWHEMAYGHYANEIELKDGVVDLLEQLKERGVRIGIATSNARSLADAVLGSRSIDEYFDAMCTAEDVVKGKPEPDVYLLAASRLGVDPKACLVFEDLPQGIIAGKRAGMRVCTVADAFSEPFWDEKTALADYAVRSLSELVEADGVNL